MTDHLPECPTKLVYDTTSIPLVMTIYYELHCICDRLRACEQRVREDMALQYLVSDREQQEQEERAFAAGVQAAREAVAALENVGGYQPSDFDHIREDVIDAIDALREETK